LALDIDLSSVAIAARQAEVQSVSLYAELHPNVQTNPLDTQ
jgi:hypothetical protein